MKRITHVPKDTTIIAGARPLRLIAPNATRAALILHGYTGYVGDMRFLAEYLHRAGLSVVAPRLPGHGTNNQDFRTTGGRDWLRAAVESYLELAADYEEVMVAGLSMGGVLTALLAAQFPVHRCALLAPALDFRNRLVPIAPLLHYFVTPYKKPITDQATETDSDSGTTQDPAGEEDPDRAYMQSEYWDWNWPRETAQLYRLARQARRALPRIICPTLTIVARQDDAVPLRVRDRIAGSIRAEQQRFVVLEESGHVITSDVEQETVAREVRDWFLG